MMETDKRKWHVDKGIPLSLIFAMLIQVFGVVWYIADIRKDVELLKATTLEQKQRDTDNERRTQESFARFQSTLDRVTDKLDRLIERAIK